MNQGRTLFAVSLALLVLVPSACGHAADEGASTDTDAAARCTSST